MDNYEKLQSHPDVQNVHPKFIGRVNGEMKVLAEVVDGTTYLTDAGRPFLSEEPAAKASKKAKKAVESADTSVGDDELNLDLKD